MLNRNINDLHPLMRDPVRKLEGVLLDAGLLGTGTAPGFRLFEGYRSPERQDHLFKTTPSVTRARGWQSAHQYGLAVDYVWWTGSEWSWNALDHPWDQLRSAAFLGGKVGLTAPLKWDLPHIEHPDWKRLKQVIPHT